MNCFLGIGIVPLTQPPLFVSTGLGQGGSGGSELLLFSLGILKAFIQCLTVGSPRRLQGR
jgi:hypothetical protein